MTIRSSGKSVFLPAFFVVLMAVSTHALSFLVPPSYRIDADYMSGSDIGQKVNSAVAKLGKRQGYISVMTEGEIRTPITLGVGQVLNFGPGFWHCTASPCITLDNASQVIGAGIYRTRLLLAENRKGPLIQSKNFSALEKMSEKQAMDQDNSLAGDAKWLPGVKYVRIKDLTLDGQKKIQKAKSNGIELYGYWFSIEDVSIERFTGDGLVTQFIPGEGVSSLGNDAMESYFTRIKLLGNNGNGWTFKGPHDSIVSGLVAANNGESGLDILHKDGYYSGGGMMLSNAHFYSNLDGLRTEPGANVLAFAVESEANRGIGLLLRSNDSVIHGTFYANGSYGIQFGDGVSFAGANVLTVQAHNNHLAQINWMSSGGYNMLTGVIFPNSENQKYFEFTPTQHDQVLTSGPYAVQHFPGGIKFDSDRNIYGGRLKKP